ncbi:cytochrome c [Phenylobacterium sp.]|uniref:c-type cytochrome n=1 Tax=Phenylobacterium sp. TaxID=1871053 RepID=UPI00272FD489|nr:cytochrome c [Phenylobacterium sp.]MDP1618768.1 cytochrome c [Phenylobacterium sp.]MDP1988547.1 cytochrome c [Phenylobacterium sp.]
MMLRNTRRSLALGLALCASLTLSGAAVAQGGAAEKAVSARQAGFKQIGASFKAVNDELKRGKPDMAAVATAANRLKTHAGQVPTWFPRGSGVESGAKTAARAEVWSDAAGFADAAANLRAQTDRLAALAAEGDVAAVRKQATQVGAACKTCHTKYREAD